MYTVHPTSLYSLTTGQIVSQQHTTDRTAGTMISPVLIDQDNLLLDIQDFSFLLY